MKKLLGSLALFLALGGAASAQVGNISNPVGANLNVQDAGVCLTAGSNLVQQLPINASTTTVTLAGTFTATVLVRESNNGGVNWTTAATLSSAGTTSYSTNGFSHLCVDITAYTSGVVQTTILTGLLQVQSVVSGGSSVSPTSGSYPAGTIDTTASKYATPIGNTIPDATFTSGAATIDCTFNNDCNFVTATDNGKVCYGTNMTTDVSILNPTSVVLPEGLLTVTDAQHATCNGGNSTATTVHNGLFVWGKYGDTQLNLAWTDCIAQNGCVYKPPPGLVLVKNAVGVTQCGGTNAMTPCTEAFGYGRIQVKGDGQFISQFAPTPSFIGASCIGGPAANGCFFSGASIQISDWGLFGAGIASAASLNGKIAIVANGNGNYNVYFREVSLLSWGAAQTGFTGLQVTSTSGESFEAVTVDGVGATNCNIASGFVSFVGVNCSVTGGSNALVSNAAYFSSFGGIYGWTPNSVNGGVVISGTSTFTSVGDVMPYALSVANSAELDCTGASVVCNIVGDYITGQGANTEGIDVFSSTVTIQGSTITGGRDGIEMGTAGSKLFSLGGNRITGTAGKSYNLTTNTGGVVFTNPTDILSGASDAIPSCAFTSGGGTTPSCTLQAGSTNGYGVIIATTGSGAPANSGTITLTFLGTYAGATGATPACTVTPDDSGTAWGNGALAKVSTQSTTAPIFAWSNSAANVLTALTASVPYRLDYTCTPR